MATSKSIPFSMTVFPLDRQRRNPWRASFLRYRMICWVKVGSLPVLNSDTTRPRKCSHLVARRRFSLAKGFPEAESNASFTLDVNSSSEACEKLRLGPPSSWKSRAPHDWDDGTGELELDASSGWNVFGRFACYQRHRARVNGLTAWQKAYTQGL